MAKVNAHTDEIVDRTDNFSEHTNEVTTTAPQGQVRQATVSQACWMLGFLVGSLVGSFFALLALVSKRLDLVVPTGNPLVDVTLYTLSPTVAFLVALLLRHFVKAAVPDFEPHGLLNLAERCFCGGYLLGLLILWFGYTVTMRRSSPWQDLLRMVLFVPYIGWISSIIGNLPSTDQGRELEVESQHLAPPLLIV